MEKLEIINGIKVFRMIITDAIRDLDCTVKNGKVVFKVVVWGENENLKVSFIKPGKPLTDDYLHYVVKVFEVSINSPELFWLVKKQGKDLVEMLSVEEKAKFEELEKLGCLDEYIEIDPIERGMEFNSYPIWHTKWMEYMYPEEMWDKRKTGYTQIHNRDVDALYTAIKTELEKI